MILMACERKRNESAKLQAHYYHKCCTNFANDVLIIMQGIAKVGCAGTNCKKDCDKAAQEDTHIHP